MNNNVLIFTFTKVFQRYKLVPNSSYFGDSILEWNYVILHVDLDSFFASVHIKYNPFLRGYPVIIGADPRNGEGRGVVSTCSYEARAYNIHSALPISKAFKQCPHGIYICSGKQIAFPQYHEETEKVMAILQKFSDKFQQAGGDEAYLDVTDIWKAYGSTPISIAEHIQSKIHKELSLPVSIGIAETKSIAKIASDLKKPRGITVIHNNDLEKKIYPLPVRKIIGVGKKTEQILHKKGILTIGNIARMPREKVFLLLGEHGLYLRKIALGMNYREVGYFRGERKSIGSERTFSHDQHDWQIIKTTVKQIVSRLVKQLLKKDLLTRTVTIKIRLQGYETYTRSLSFQNFLSNESVIYNTAIKLLDEFRYSSKKVRLIGVRVSSLKSGEGQLSLTPFLSHNS